MKELYQKKLKYASYCDFICYQNDKLYIIYLGTQSFIIIYNFYGCIASGERVFDYETKTININYTIYHDEITKTAIQKVIKKHEKNFNIPKDIKYNIICKYLEV